MTNENYELEIILPSQYGKKVKRYKTLYLLDGNNSSKLGEFMLNRLAGEIDDLIIVGIGYSGKLASGPGDTATQRWRDYPTPADSYWKVPIGQGAPQFYRTLSEEIIPYVDGHYMTDQSHRGLGGHSMGGFFTMWAMFHSTGVFDRYWISSPSLVWDDGVLDREEKAYAATHDDLDATVFADAGELEDRDMNDGLRELGERLQAHGYRSLRWHQRFSPDLGHSGAMVESAPYAFYALYGTPVAKISSNRLRAFSGTYEVAQGQRFSIMIDESDAYLVNSSVEDFQIKRAKLLSTEDGNLILRYVGLKFNANAADVIDTISVQQEFEGAKRPELIARRVK